MAGQGACAESTVHGRQELGCPHCKWAAHMARRGGEAECCMCSRRKLGCPHGWKGRNGGLGCPCCMYSGAWHAELSVWQSRPHPTPRAFPRTVANTIYCPWLPGSWTDVAFTKTKQTSLSYTSPATVLKM